MNNLGSTQGYAGSKVSNMIWTFFGTRFPVAQACLGTHFTGEDNGALDPPSSTPVC